MPKVIKLPGLIDTHVHLREPGSTQKEDFETGTKAAIAGGYTLVLDMPNNISPVVSTESLEKKIGLANGRIYADLGFHFGATYESTRYFGEISGKVFGLKVYMNHTTGPLLVENQGDLEKIFKTWPKDKVLMTHSEDDTLNKAIELARKYGNKIHICHVNSAKQVEVIKNAKDGGLDISCETALHYLYMSGEDVKRMGNFARMRPPLGSMDDQKALWDGINSGIIDTIASDHAPHTKAEKEGETVVNGVPGLETSLPLLLNSVNTHQLTVDKLIEITSTNPRKIFGIPVQDNTFVEVDLEEDYEIKNERLFTKCRWSPFDGLRVKGKIIRSVLRGTVVYEDGRILEEPVGKVVFP